VESDVILPIFLCNQPELRKKAKPVRSLDESLRSLALNMLDTMHNAGGVGLAANQVGSLRRIIVVDVSELEEYRERPPMALINPEVIFEEGSSIMEEGCLSIPDVRDEVERPEKITVRFRDLDWNEQNIDLEGFPARVVLHEIDHLDGVLFIDHLPLLKRKLLRGRLNKIRKGEIEVRYPIISDATASKSADLIVR
jgi:peptide deformylase